MRVFLLDLADALPLLCQFPIIGSSRFAYLFPGIDLRTWSIHRFPFRIFYATKGNYLHIFRIGHERRNVTSNLIGVGKPLN